MVARMAHNHEVASSSLARALNTSQSSIGTPGCRTGECNRLQPSMSTALSGWATNPTYASTTMPSFRQNRRALMDAAIISRQAARESRMQFPAIGPSRCVPNDVQSLADQIQRHSPSRACRCSDCERGRRMLAKGMPPAELTNRHGESRRPQFASEG